SAISAMVLQRDERVCVQIPVSRSLCRGVRTALRAESRVRERLISLDLRRAFSFSSLRGMLVGLEVKPSVISAVKCPVIGRPEPLSFSLLASLAPVAFH